MPGSKNDFSKYAKFSGLAIQMGVVIAAFTWLGIYLDERYKTNRILIVVFSLIGVAVGLYIVIREVIQMSKDDEK